MRNAIEAGFELVCVEQPKVNGWCSLEKAFVLYSIVVALRPAVSVEIGVCSGSSFIPIALAHKAIGYGVAVGIDAWSSDVMRREYAHDAKHQAAWANVDQDKTYKDFLLVLEKLQLHEFTRIVRNESIRSMPPSSCGLLHIDGGHSDTAITDVLRFAPKVSSGGFVVVDDLDGTHGPGPIKAESRLLTLGFKKLYVIGTGAVFQRST